ALAARYGRPVADKPDSQDICFVPNGNYAAVIEKLRPGAAEPGDIVDQSGTVLGQHRGVIHYTIGQRKGIGVGGKKGASGEAWYVARKNLEANTLTIVQGHDHPLLMSRGLEALEASWIAGRPPVTPSRRSGMT
ncbi:MAG: hypothetical protein NWQ32_04320, partial [Paracoccaceae bacterium]|nr:hypothetical protein [Paracoccaceae bacterium]